jgi:hypothetical protein
MAKFQTVVKRARFSYSPFTAYEMQGFAQALADSIKDRIHSGQNIYDQAAAPLKLPWGARASVIRNSYPSQKAKRGLQAIRDWTWTGHTLRCLKVLTVNQNRAEIGFLDDTMPGRTASASQIAWYNNQRERQWGVSPRDRDYVTNLMLHYRPMVTLQDMTQGTYFAGMRAAEFNQYMSGTNGMARVA